jgi:hypothetical protein
MRHTKASTVVAGLSVFAALLMQAAPASATTPERVQITNVTSQKFTVHWFTSVAEQGYVVWGTNAASLTTQAYDIRGSGTSRYVHYVEVPSSGSLTPVTTYFFRIVSGGTSYGPGGSTDPNCQPFSVKTTLDIAQTTPTTYVSGDLFKTAGVSLTDEVGDTNNSLSNWGFDNSGIKTSTTAAGFLLYYTVKDVGGTRTVRVFKSTDIADGSADLVCMGSRTLTGDIALSSQNGSGLNGKVTLDSFTADDADTGNVLTINEAVVVARVRDNNAAGSPGTSAARSILVQSSRESWFYDNTGFFLADGTAYFDFSASGDIIDVNMDGGPLGSNQAVGLNTSSFVGTNPYPYDIDRNLETTPALPVIRSVTPNTGDNTTATDIVITGNNLTFAITSGATAPRLVRSGYADVLLTGVVVVADDTIRGVVPSGVTAGNWAVVVDTSAGNSGTTVTTTNRFVPVVPGASVTAGGNTSAPGQDASSLSINLTTPTNVINRVALAGISIHTTGASVTQATLGGQAMTKVGHYVHASGAPRVEIWRFNNPPTGTNTIQVQFSVPATAVVGAAGFANVYQNDVLTFYGSEGTDDAPTVNVTSTVSGGAVFGTVAAIGEDSTMTPAQTVRWNTIFDDFGGTIIDGGGSWISSTGAPVAMSWTLDSLYGTCPWVMGAVALRIPVGSQSNTTDSWSVATKPMGVARAMHAITPVSVGGELDQVLAIGGHDGSVALGSVELFDLSANTWTPKKPLVYARYGHRAVTLTNGKILVAGGRDTNDGPVACAELYDPATDTWTCVANLSSPRAGHTATLLSDGRVLVAGGESADYTILSSTEIFDPTSNTWSAGPAMTVARAWHAAASLGTTVVLAGGWRQLTPSTSEILSSCDLYSEGSPGTIAPTGSMATARMSFQAIYLPGTSRVYAVGGYGAAGALSSVEQFNGTSWSAASAMTTARVDFAAIATGVSSFLVVGGWNGAPGGTSAIAGLGTSQTFSSGSWGSEQTLLTASWECGMAAIGTSGSFIRAGGWVNGLASRKPTVNTSSNPTNLPAAYRRTKATGGSVAPEYLAEASDIVPTESSELMAADGFSSATPGQLPDGGADGGFCFAGVLGGFGAAGAAAGLLAAALLTVRRRR